MGSDARGVALIDVVCAIAMVLVMGAMAVPVIGGTLEREHLAVGAQFLSAQVQRARLEALKRQTSVALRIELVGERARVQMFADGNGNGVLQRDIDRGTDVALSRQRRSLGWDPTWLVARLPQTDDRYCSCQTLSVTTPSS